MFSNIKKVIELFISNPRKIPQAMIAIFVFTYLFPSEAVRIKDIFISRVLIVLPGSVKEFWSTLNITRSDFITVWTFLLLAYAITMVMDILHHYLNSGNFTHIRYSQTGELLLEINTIIFLAVLIHNVMYYPGIIIFSVNFTGFYSISALTAALLFGFHFAIIYLSDIGRLYVRLENSDIPLIKKTVLLSAFWLIIIPLSQNLWDIFVR